jgi:hypothetical protein
LPTALRSTVLRARSPAGAGTAAKRATSAVPEAAHRRTEGEARARGRRCARPRRATDAASTACAPSGARTSPAATTAWSAETAPWGGARATPTATASECPVLGIGTGAKRS